MVTNPKKPWLEKFLESLQFLFLVAAAGMGIYVEIVDRFWVHKVPEKLVPGLTLGIVAALAIVLGLERFTQFKRIDTQFDQITRIVEQALPPKALLNEIDGIIEQKLPTRLLVGAEVSSAATRLVNSAEQSIKVLLYEEDPSQASRRTNAARTSHTRQYQAVGL